MTGWRKTLLMGFSIGCGFSITLVLCWAGFTWYKNHPRPPKPWDSSAITATFDHLDVEGEKNTLVFWYTLENRTDWDYRLINGNTIHLMARLEEQGSLSSAEEGFEKFDSPVYLPARQKLRYGIHIAYPYEGTNKSGDTLEERRAFRKLVAAWVNENLPNLNGFVLFDDERRYQIMFPKGW